ncbi:MAG TPA: hypothetical protein VIL42_03485 [Sphingomicrobium sp.]|jgi:hypothetical protein
MSTTCEWPGASGRTYTYHVYGVGTSFKTEPGNYIFAKVANGKWVPVYIGESECLGERCTSTHHKWEAALKHGATHIHAHLNKAGLQSRLDEETDLRRNFNTPCNDQ